ncbi:MAG TPA: SGNH/GDSL hydrolase family protein [Opitutaceae bacterium]
MKQINRTGRPERPPSRGAVIAACLAVLLPSVTSADARNPEGKVPGKAAFKAVNVIGDSLSDTGRTFSAIGIPPFPYFNGRTSDGPLWVEYLMPDLGLEYESLDNFSWAGAMTGRTNVFAGLPGMLDELDEYVGTLHRHKREDKRAESQALHVVFGGANDFIRILEQGANPFVVIPEGVANLVAIISRLHALGAKHIMVVDLPNIGVTPRVRAIDAVFPGTAANVTGLCGLFNTLLGNATEALGIDVIHVSAFELLTAAFNDPASFGFTNVTEQGIMNIGAADTYLFWDDIHPTTGMHEVLAAAMLEAIEETFERGRCGKGGNGYFSSRHRHRRPRIRPARRFGRTVCRRHDAPFRLVGEPCFLPSLLALRFANFQSA